MGELSDWIENLGLGKYASVFADNEIDFEVLAELTDQDLREMDIPLGPRKKLLRAIAGLATERSPDTGETRPSPAVAAATVPAVMEAERRQLTVMFCDLVGSTALSVRFDPEKMHSIIRAYQDCCVEVIDHFGGHVARFMGDGVLAFFGYPEAHEDDAERAVLAGLGLVEAVARIELPDVLTLQVRVGIGTGPVVVGDLIGGGALQQEDVVGETPNLAARLQGLAEANAVVIADNTKRLVGGLFDYAELGKHELKGFPEPVAVWRVMGKGSVESRFEAAHAMAGLTPLVGREEEFDLLKRRWQQAKSGAGQVVLLCGEPGIGKSRLTQHLRDYLSQEPHTYLLYYCSPYYQNSALFPIIQQIERAARFTRDDTPAAKLDKLEALLARSAPESVAEMAPLFAALLSIPTQQRYPPLQMSPRRQKEKIQEALIAQLIGLSRQKPVLMIFEDLHWIDPTSLELFDQIVEQVQDLPVLLLCTFRPEFASSWVGHPNVTVQTLNRLNQSKTEQIANRLTAGKALPAEVLEHITAHTDGVPLFIEELTRTVLEAGILSDQGDRYTLSGPLSSLAIPSTLHDSLMARLDRLAPIKTIIQIGAVIGRHFPYSLIAELAPIKGPELQSALAQLAETKLITGRGSPPDVTYAFKHALVRDTAYASLLRSKQRILHARIGKVLQDKFSEQAAIEPELIAYHYTEAGLSSQAIDYWYKAGQHSLERSSYTEALAHLNKGLELLKALPEDHQRDRQELRLQTARAAALQATLGFSASETGQAYARAHELCARLGDAPEIFPVLHGIYLFHALRGEIELAYEAGKECLSQAQRQNTPIGLLFGHRTIGASLMHLGEFAAARDHLSKILALAESQESISATSVYGIGPKTAATAFLGLTLFALGCPKQAAKAAHDALSFAEQAGHLHNLGYALFWANMTGIQLSAFAAVQERAQRLMTLGQEQGFPHWAAFGRVQYGIALAELSDIDEGIAQMKQGLAQYRSLGSTLYLPSMLASLAVALVNTGQFEEAAAILDEALSHAQHSRETWYEAELHRHIGELVLSQGRCDAGAEGENHLCRALDVARRQDALAWELRAATRLARLWCAQGRNGSARELLAPIYNAYTEGLDSVDLRNARDLLEKIAPD